jgi:hypothetical protein
MQHYAINRLPDTNLSSLPYAVREDPTLQAVAGDFKEEIVDYQIDDLPNQRSVRPKTLGFTLMALLLGNGRLLERVLSLLGECSVTVLEAEQSLQGVVTTTSSIQIMSTMQTPVAPLGIPGAYKAITAEDIDLELDLSMMGFNEEFFSCDGSYWREKVVSNCVGLLYECSLREGRFLELVMSSPPLTILRSEDGRTAALPVMIQGGLVEVLSSCLALGTIAHFLRLPPKRWHSVPSVPVMATRLLEHVSTSQSSARFLWALRSNVVEEGYLLSGCVRAIMEGDETESAAIFEEIIRLGADRYPDVFTQAASSSGGPPDVSTALQSAASGLIEASETTRGALLSLMLRTLVLTPDRICLTHQLLGMRQAIEQGESINGIPTLAKPLKGTVCIHTCIYIYIYVFICTCIYVHIHLCTHIYVHTFMYLFIKGTGGDLPCNCLQAILLLITPSTSDHTMHTSSLIQREPELACICYELIYQLCAAPLTSALTLSYLRIRAVQFLHVQIQELLYLACLPDSLLLNKDKESAESR